MLRAFPELLNLWRFSLDAPTIVSHHIYIRSHLILFLHDHGRRLRGTGWRFPPQNLRWRDGLCIRPPNIMRSAVIGCEAKYELTKQRCQGEIFYFEIEVLVKILVKKMVLIIW